MSIHSLFDDGRKQRIRDALRRDDLASIFRKRSEPERHLPGMEGPSENKFGRVPGTESGLLMLSIDPPQYELRSKAYSANELLLLAIIFNDLETATSAVAGGADVNHVFDRFPPSPPGSEIDYSHIPSFPKCSVLKLAHGIKSRQEIEKLLIDNGAKE